MNRSRHVRPLDRNLIHDRPPEQRVRLLRARANNKTGVQWEKGENNRSDPFFRP